MKNLLFAFIACLLYCSCNAQSKPLSEEQVFALNKYSYRVLNKVLKDSLNNGLTALKDYDQLYTPAQRVVLDSLISGFQKGTNLQVALLVFDSNMVADQTVKDITIAIGIQHRKAVTIGISLNQRSLYIRTDSLVKNTLMNEKETKAIIERYIVPKFAKEKYYEATVDGLNAIFNTIRKKYSNQKATVKQG